MARKLPWTAHASPNPAAPRTVTRKSPVSKKEDDEAADIKPPSTPSRRPKHPRGKASSRSPSTSPIRDPVQNLPEIEAMHPADSKYIMVEDEFESTARQFTLHLHAAEYARLKRQAKAQPPRLLPSLSSNMSTGAKMNVERKALLSRQETALSGFLGSGVGVEGSDAEEQAKEEKVKDPWLGTSLAELMAEGAQRKTSLVGLERLGGRTRAAGGFVRGEGAERVEDKRVGNAEMESVVVVDKRQRNREPDTSGDDDGVRKQRDKVSTMSSRASGVGDREANRHDDRPQSGAEIRHVKPDEHKTNTSSAPKSIQTSRKRRRFDDLDELDDTPVEIKSITTPRKQDAKKDRKSRLDEVPLFLV